MITVPMTAPDGRSVEVTFAAAPGFRVERGLRGFQVTCTSCGGLCYFEVGSPPPAEMRHARDCAAAAEGTKEKS